MTMSPGIPPEERSGAVSSSLQAARRSRRGRELEGELDSHRWGWRTEPSDLRSVAVTISTRVSANARNVALVERRSRVKLYDHERRQKSSRSMQARSLSGSTARRGTPALQVDGGPHWASNQLGDFDRDSRAVRRIRSRATSERRRLPADIRTGAFETLQEAKAPEPLQPRIVKRRIVG